MTRLTRFHPAVLAALLLTACDGADGGPPPGPPPLPEFTVAVSTPTVSVPAGGSATVTVTVTPSGAAVPVTLGVAAAPAGLGVTFTPAQTTTTSTLNVSAGTVEPGTYSVFVRGVAKAGSTDVVRTVPLAITVAAPTTLTLGGRAVGRTGEPLAGAAVAVGLHSATTDADGRFILTDVAAPYTVTVKPAGSSTIHEFVGLTRPDPTLPLDHAGPTARSASVSGSVTGLPLPVPAGRSVVLHYSGTGHGRGFTAIGAGDTGAYAINALWTGTSGSTGSIMALAGVLSPASTTLFESYTGVATRTVSLGDGGAVTTSALTLEPLGADRTRSLGVFVKAAAGLTVSGKQLYVNASGQGGLLIGIDNSSSTTSTYRTPVLPGRTVTVLAGATAGGRTSAAQRAGLLPDEVATLTLPAPAGPVAPAAGATGVPLSASVSWTAVPGSVYRVSLSGRVVYTAATSYAPPLHAGQTYAWHVQSVGPAATVDELAGGMWASGYPQAGDDATVTYTTSESRTFSTAP